MDNKWLTLKYDNNENLIVETRVFVASITISIYLVLFFEYFSNVDEKKTENQHRSICVECIQKSNDMN